MPAAQQNDRPVHSASACGSRSVPLFSVPGRGGVFRCLATLPLFFFRIRIGFGGPFGSGCHQGPVDTKLPPRAGIISTVQLISAEAYRTAAPTLDAVNEPHQPVGFERIRQRQVRHAQITCADPRRCPASNGTFSFFRRGSFVWICVLHVEFYRFTKSAGRP